MKTMKDPLMLMTMLLAAIALMAIPARSRSTEAPRQTASSAEATVASSTGELTPRLVGLPDSKALEARYPESDAVVLFDSLIVTLDDENRISKRRRRAVMLFTDNAINRYGDPRILFNSATQELSIISACVYMRDGTVIDTEKNGINQTTPFALDHAPDYADWQETVVTHVGVEKGCVAELHYLIRDRAPSPWLSGVEIFGSEDPVERRVLVVAPGRRGLKTSHLNGAPAHEEHADDAWSWTMSDIPGRTPFDGGVWQGDYLPAVCYSIGLSWDEALPALGAELAVKSAAVPAAESRIRDAVKALSTNEERVLAIHALAIDAVTSVRAAFALFAAPARDAARVYDSGYASPLDHAVLLAAMLRGAGFEPTFVLASAGRRDVGDWPALELFSRLMVAVKMDDAGELLLDPTAPFEHDPSFALAGKYLAALDPEPAFRTLRSKNHGDSRSTLTIDLGPGEDGALEGSGTAVLKGAFSPYYLLWKSADGLEAFLGKRVTGLFGGAELVSWSPRFLDRDRAELEFVFKVPLADAKKGERMYLTVPMPFESALSGLERVHVERSSCADAIRIEPCELEVSCTIEAPAGWKVVTPSFSANEANDTGTAAVAFSASRSDGTNLFQKRLVMLDGDLVLPVSYGELRSLARAFGEDRIVLEKE